MSLYNSLLTYVSPDTINNITNIIPENIKNSLPESSILNINTNTNTNTNTNINTLLNTSLSTPSTTNKVAEEDKIKLNVFEESLEKDYVGCYLDDPTNLTMSEYLGTVNNQLECINKGIEQEYKYIGIQQGDKCYASNILPESESKRKNCNITCTNINQGNCGGYYYNQVYKTNVIKPEAILDTFENINNDINTINNNLDNSLFTTNEPINPYILLVSIVIIILIIMITFDYITNKNF